MGIKWSFSGLKDYVNCPRQYNEVKILQNYTKAVTQQMQYGTDVHKALEDYARDGTELPFFYQRFKPMADSLLAIDGTRYLEYKMALNQDREPCDFNSKDYWVRGIVDFMVVQGDTAYIVDYKTGSAKYPDTKQLKLMSLMAFAHLPELQSAKAGLLFVAHNSFINEEYHRDNSEKMWQTFMPDLDRLRYSQENGHWPPNPTPLCGWCPVTVCEYHRSRR
jgi:CRISPR/Cas system-associated exonuclease Cas4 (RecB family)